MQPSPSVPVVVTPHDVVEDFLAGKKASTIAAYKRDLVHFAKFLGVETVHEAASILFGNGHGNANRTALQFKNVMMASSLAPATINRRLAAVRSLTKAARLMGAVSFSLDVSGVRAKTYKDTKGPGADVARTVLDAHRAMPQTPKVLRDIAMFRLLLDCALRNGEVGGLSLEDVDVEGSTVRILGKGDLEQTVVQIPPLTLGALAAWLEVHEGFDAVFYSLERRSKGHRLTGTSIWRTIRSMGKKVGVELRPHGLRHTGITEALARTNGNVSAVQRYSRHASTATLTIYDDNRTDPAGDIADKVSRAIG